MIFNELSYFVLFLAPAVAMFHLAPAAWRPWTISAFGILFFIYFGYLHFGGGWGALCVVIFLWEILFSRLYRPRSAWCIAGIVQAVLLLMVFKYLTIATQTWNHAAALMALPPLTPIGRLVLPLGLSFFTFEFIHYAADRYAGKVERAPMRDYAAFILFFPSMVAGPIKRFQDFGPKLRAARFDLALASRGVTRILAGLAKKLVLADTFAFWAGKLNGPELYSGHWYEITGWVLAYGMQIYFDFSGYSDIAIGSGYLFGIALPENFNWPYVSRNIREFWRRWHISLSFWIRSYVYLPLGGSHRGEARTAVNLMIAFALAGAWHGAAYNFIAWGLWHGVLVVIHRQWTLLSPRWSLRMPEPVAWLLTFASVNAGWAFFCMDIRRALTAFSRVVHLS